MNMILHELKNRHDVRLSPFAWRIRMALKHKGLDFQTEGHEFLDIKNIGDGSHKTVPVLQDGERFIGDSAAIAAYLDEKFPQTPLMPGGFKAQGINAFLQGWIQTQVHIAMTKAIVVAVRDDLTAADQVYFNESRAKRFGVPIEDVYQPTDDQCAKINAALAPLAAMLESQDFLGGGSASYADYQLFGNFMWVKVTSDVNMITAGSPIDGWWQRCLDLHGGYARAYLTEIGRG